MTTATATIKPSPTARLVADMMSPFDLTVVGIDPSGPNGEVQGPEHYLWDPRIELPVDRGMVESIKRHGVFTPVLAQTDGPRSLIVEGRRRVIHARIACQELQAAGQDPIRIPVLYKRGDDKTIVAIGNEANAHRLQDSPLIAAYKAQRGLDMGKSLAAVAAEFNVSPETVEDWQRLLDLHPEIKAKLHTKEIGVNAGLALSVLPRNEQVQTLQEVTQDLKPRERASAAKVTAKVREKQGKAPSKTPSVRIGKIQETLTRFVKKGVDAATKDDLLAILSTICSLATDRSLNKFTAKVKADEMED